MLWPIGPQGDGDREIGYGGPRRATAAPPEKYPMRDLKGSGLTDRLAAAAEAKTALLAKLKPKPTVTDPLFAEREAMKAEALDAVRQQRAVERADAKQAAVDKAVAAQALIDADEAAQLADKRGVRKERKQLGKAEAKAKRDARYAARKAR